MNTTQREKETEEEERDKDKTMIGLFRIQLQKWIRIGIKKLPWLIASHMLFVLVKSIGYALLSKKEARTAMETFCATQYVPMQLVEGCNLARDVDSKYYVELILTSFWDEHMEHIWQCLSIPLFVYHNPLTSICAALGFGLIYYVVLWIAYFYRIHYMNQQQQSGTTDWFYTNSSAAKQKKTNPYSETEMYSSASRPVHSSEFFDSDMNHNSIVSIPLSHRQQHLYSSATTSH